MFVDKPGFKQWSGSAGYFDGQRTIPLKPGRKFRIASITKTFIATIVLQLMEEGLLNLDDSIFNYLPDEVIEILTEDTYSTDITVYHTLCHRSGIYDFVNTSFFSSSINDRTEIWTTEEKLLCVTVQI